MPSIIIFILNPVRVGILKAVEAEEGALEKTLLCRRRERLRDYEWSSYRDYAGLRRRAQWLSLETVREGADLSVAAYRRELDERITHERLGLDWKGELVARVLMGSGAVVARWKRLLAKQTSSGSKSEGKRFGVVSWEEIVAAIEKEWGQPWEQLRSGRGTNARTIAIWFARHRAGMKLEQVREQLQARSYTAVAMQVGRLQRQLPHQPQLRKRLSAVARHLNVQC